MQNTLPIHPRTGLSAVGIVAGKPVWPIFGAEDNPPAAPAGQPAPVPTPPAQPPTPPASGQPAPTNTPPAGDPPKGTPDVLADLAKEREKRQALETEIAKSLGIELSGGGPSHLAQITGRLAPLAKLAEALGGSTGDPATGPTDIEKITERLTKHEEQLAEANQARWRAEVANAKKLSPEQAAELRGTTAEELTAHADRLLALFPTAPLPPGTPRPDPHQGGLGGGSANLDSQIVEAQKAGDVRKVIALQRQKLHQ